MKDERHLIFAQFIATTLLPDGVCGDTRVLDIAGGKGHLSAELAATGVPCLLVDPCAGRS